MSVRIITGDCRDVLPTLAAGSVQTCVTSPPYWGLRDYQTGTWEGGDPACDHVKGRGGHLAESIHSTRGGAHKVAEAQAVPYRDVCGRCDAVRVDRQIGLEASVDEWVAALVGVFREVRRVLRDDGTLFLNLGDAYATGTTAERKPTTTTGPTVPASWSNRSQSIRNGNPKGIKPKDLIGLPWLVAFALRADGWYLRSEITWVKKNPMPESVRDRPTSATEKIFLLTKKPTYFYDSVAVREEAEYGYSATVVRSKGNGWDHDDKESKTVTPGNGGSRNLRNAWTIATQSFPGSHFAVFPEKLVEPCVKAGTSERGACPACGAPWRRTVEHEGMTPRERGKQVGFNGYAAANPGNVNGLHHAGHRGDHLRTHRTTGWQPSCRCQDAGEPVPQTVLDCFGGSGTTGLVADQLGRDAVLIELNHDYAEMSRKRITNDAPLFAHVEVS